MLHNVRNNLFAFAVHRRFASDTNLNPVLSDLVWELSGCLQIPARVPIFECNNRIKT